MAEENEWTEIAGFIQEAVDQGHTGSDGAGLDVYSAENQLVYSKTFGSFSRKEHYQIGSATKWLTTSVILSMIKDGLISLDGTSGKWLDWKGKKGEITIRNLLSLTSGFHIPPAEAPNYLYTPGVSIKDCVDSLYRDYELLDDPGKIASYGPVGFVIAGRIAEVAAGISWQQLFWERLGNPLGFDRQKTKYNSQQLAASLVTTMEEYGRFLEMINNRGIYRGKTILSPELVREQMIDQWAKDTRIESSPYMLVNKSFHYGLGVWRECPDPSDVRECDKELIVTCAGMFGWYPWIDIKNDYYGLLAMVKPIGARPPGYVTAFRLLEKIRPLMNNAMLRTKNR